MFFLTLFLVGIGSLALTIVTENNLKSQVLISQTQNDLRLALIRQLQGRWIHEDDNKACILIKGTKWTFNFRGIRSTAADNYLITITDQLPGSVDKNEKAAFLMLTQKTDTLQYEIIGLTDKTLSMMNFPGGSRALYIKK